MKIKSLQFYDYRVFYAESESDKKDYFIDVDSKNLLLYGENGSGKTSFFRGLKDIVHSEDFTSHFKTPILNDGYLEIAFDDNSTDRFDATGTKATKAELLNVNKLNSFLSYKELLKTHLHDDTEINFFEIIVNDILKEHNLQTLGQLKSAWDSLRTRNIEQEKEVINASVPAEITEEEAIEQIEILDVEYNEQITKFNDEFDELLELINQEIDTIARYFNQGVSIRFELEELNRVNLSEPKLNSIVNYAASNLPSHHKFLNEARLSAIAISVYLTALQTNPTDSVMKFIFLDDIFLGLDLNNRLPLLDILKDRFSDWQIFLTTYDRHWFEVAKLHLEPAKWKAIEMYAGEVVGKPFEKPIIIDSENYFEKADKYYKAGDYPAALNYLRKELESQIKERLPEESTRNYEGRPHQLESLWGMLIERYDRNGQSNLISKKIKDELKTLKFSLLHPQSHDTLSFPVYKYELQRAFQLIKDIQAIPVIRGITLLISGMELVFKHPTISYSVTFRLEDDWLIDVHNGVQTPKYPKCRLIKWQLNGTDFWHMLENRVMTPDEIEAHNALPKNNLATIIKQESYHINNPLLRPLTKDQFESYTTLENVWTLKELIQKSNNQKRDNWFCRIFRK